MKSLLRMTKNQFSPVGARHPHIELRQGVVRGIEEHLPRNGTFYSFKGVPYARPPIGNLRFEVCVVIVFHGSIRLNDMNSLFSLQSPRPLDKFNEDVLDCSGERDVCY